MTKSLDIALMAWEAISPAGIGAKQFASSEAIDPSIAMPEDFTEAQYPPDLEYKFAPYEGRKFLGPKGTRTMDRTTALAVGAAKLLYEARPFSESNSERSGFIVGTSTGSIRSTSDFTRETFVQDRPFLVNPALFPNTVMNCAAGQCAIWFKARGVNATIAAGRLSGFMSLQYGSMMLRRKYADLLYAGAVEELCPQTAWAHKKLTDAGHRVNVPQGEGGVMFAMERASDLIANGENVRTKLHALQCRRYFDVSTVPTQQAINGIMQCIKDTLERVQLTKEDIRFVSIGASSDKLVFEMERAAVDAYFGSNHPVLIDVIDKVGETYSAAFSFKLAGLLAHPEFQNGSGSQFGLVLSATHDGYVGAALVSG